MTIEQLPVEAMAKLSPAFYKLAILNLAFLRDLDYLAIYRREELIDAAQKNLNELESTKTIIINMLDNLKSSIIENVDDAKRMLNQESVKTKQYIEKSMKEQSDAQLDK